MRLRKIMIAFTVTALLAFGSTIVELVAQTPKSSQSHKQIYGLNGHIWDVTSLAYTRDGATLVSGSLDQTIKVWNLKNGKLVSTLSGHQDGVNAMAISPDGQILLTAGGSAKSNTEKIVKLWNLKTKKPIRTLTGHNQGVTSLAIAPDGQTLASGSYDKTIKLWNLKGELLRTLTGHGSWVRAIAISPDGQTLASGGGSLDTNTDTDIRLWNLKTGELLRTLTGHSNSINFIAFSANGKSLVSSADPLVNVWNLNSGNVVRSFDVSNTIGITSASLNSNGDLATTTLDGAVTLWNINTGQPQITIVQPTINPQNYDQLYPTSTAFSPDGKSFAIGHGGGAYLSKFPITVFKMP